MDGYELILGTIVLASITTWVAMWNGRRTAKLMEMRFETICIAIAWIAALLVGAWFVF